MNISLRSSLSGPGSAFLRPPGPRPPADWEQPVVDAARRVHFRFGLSGLRWGDSGPVSLMLHGWGGGPSQFAALVRPLLAAGRQVIALDAPGHGSSDGGSGTLMEFVLALQEAAVEIPELESVVGHSMGAAAVAMAVSEGLSADRVLLYASPSSIERQFRGYAARFKLDARQTDQLIDDLEAANGVPVGHFELPRRVARLKQPLLIVHDSDDAQVPYAEAERIVAAWPWAELMATDGLGHNRILSDARVVARASAFLVGRRAAVLSQNSARQAA